MNRNLTLGVLKYENEISNQVSLKSKWKFLININYNVQYNKQCKSVYICVLIFYFPVNFNWPYLISLFRVNNLTGLFIFEQRALYKRLLCIWIKYLMLHKAVLSSANKRILQFYSFQSQKHMQHIFMFFFVCLL